MRRSGRWTWPGSRIGCGRVYKPLSPGLREGRTPATRSRRTRSAGLRGRSARTRSGASPGPRCPRRVARAVRTLHRLEPLEPHEVVPLHLLQSLADERLRRPQLGDHAELQGVDAALHLLNLLDEPAHRRLDLSGGDHVLDAVLVRLRGLAAAGARPDDPVAALVDRFADRLRVDLRHDD